jgi:hypothetical protein
MWQKLAVGYDKKWVFEGLLDVCVWGMEGYNREHTIIVRTNCTKVGHFLMALLWTSSQRAIVCYHTSQEGCQK